MSKTEKKQNRGPEPPQLIQQGEIIKKGRFENDQKVNLHGFGGYKQLGCQVQI